MAKRTGDGIVHACVTDARTDARRVYSGSGGVLARSSGDTGPRASYGRRREMAGAWPQQPAAMHSSHSVWPHRSH